MRDEGNGAKPPPPKPRDPNVISMATENGNDPASTADKIHASRTIINHVIQNGEGVLSTNAMSDQRFSKGKSVHNLGIRSALCVPIKARKLNGKPGGDEVIGVIYIDSSVKNYTYSPDQLRPWRRLAMISSLCSSEASGTNSSPMLRPSASWLGQP